MGIFMTVLAWIFRISPIILTAIKPWLRKQDGDLWRLALPLARAIVTEVDVYRLPGLEKHQMAVHKLQQEVKEILHAQLPTGDAQHLIIAAFNQILEARQ